MAFVKRDVQPKPQIEPLPSLPVPEMKPEPDVKSSTTTRAGADSKKFLSPMCLTNEQIKQEPIGESFVCQSKKKKSATPKSVSFVDAKKLSHLTIERASNQENRFFFSSFLPFFYFVSIELIGSVISFEFFISHSPCCHNFSFLKFTHIWILERFFSEYTRNRYNVPNVPQIW